MLINTPQVIKAQGIMKNHVIPYRESMYLNFNAHPPKTQVINTNFNNQMPRISLTRFILSFQYKLGSSQ